MKKIDQWAFYHCPALLELTIPESVTEFGDKSVGYMEIREYTSPEKTAYRKKRTEQMRKHRIIISVITGILMLFHTACGTYSATAEEANAPILAEEDTDSEKETAAEPFYQYYDSAGNLCLELYLDEETGSGSGIAYHPLSEGGYEPHEFAFDTCKLEDWKEMDPFSLKAVDGTDGSDMVNDYEELCEYTESGQIEHFRSWGNIDWLVESGGMQTILEINFVYREDGTLASKEYYHNGYLFGSTNSSKNSFYDEKERLVYEEAYITHGSLDIYYIYTDDSPKPSYRLLLDGDYTDMIQYK